MTPMPHSPYSPISSLVVIFLNEEVLQGKGFADVEEVKQKAEAL